MLVLSRRDQETVVIDGNIRITVIRTSSNSVRLGIEAPPHVPVHRGEVQARVEAEAGHPAPRRKTGLLQQRLARTDQRSSSGHPVPSNETDAA